jgi:endogenous inhibitor of DNA gyrase (YacG/DUF329 family)
MDRNADEIFLEMIKRLSRMRMSMSAKKVKCPVCGTRTVWEDNPFRPFCSERCRLLDLGKWASEDYRIPGDKKDLPDEEEKEK